MTKQEFYKILNRRPGLREQLDEVIRDPMEALYIYLAANLLKVGANIQMGVDNTFENEWVFDSENPDDPSCVLNMTLNFKKEV